METFEIGCFKTTDFTCEAQNILPTASSIGNSMQTYFAITAINQNSTHSLCAYLFQRLDHRSKLGSRPSVARPTATHQIGQAPVDTLLDHRPRAVQAHRAHKVVQIVKLGKRLAQRQQLPQHNAKRIHIGFLVKRFAFHHLRVVKRKRIGSAHYFWGHPQWCALNAATSSVLQIKLFSRRFKLRKTKITNKKEVTLQLNVSIKNVPDFNTQMFIY